MTAFHAHPSGCTWLESNDSVLPVFVVVALDAGAACAIIAIAISNAANSSQSVDLRLCMFMMQIVFQDCELILRHFVTIFQISVRFQILSVPEAIGCGWTT